LLVGSPTRGREGVENGLLFMTLNSFPPKHCLLYSIEKVGLGTGEAAVEKGAAASNRGKWSEREERVKGRREGR
jgi:hypothetical protein